MKRLLITMVALAIITANSFAQVQSDIQSATLIHGDQTSVYYGANAFYAAYYAAADEGDIIVLSAGSFNNSSDISKSITIYGRGYETDTESGLEPTKLSNPLYIKEKESYDELGNQMYVYPTVTIEGIYGTINVYPNAHETTIKNLTIRKCKGAFELSAMSENCLISQCVFTDFRLSYQSATKQTSLTIENSWLASIVGSERVDNTILIDHCIIRSFNQNLYNYRLAAHYTNNIIYPANLATSSTTTNNIFVTSSGSTETVDANGNWHGVSNTLVWADANENGDYAATKTFALKFPAKYVGTDGTQVGINGGNAPFDRISPIPRILAADVDLRTAEDGKLNVSFKVEAQTKE